MSDLLVTPRGTSRAAAAAAALSSGFIIADRLRPYVEQGVSTLKRAYGSLRDQSQVRYGPGSGRYRREQQLARKRTRRERELVKKKLDFEEKSTLELPRFGQSSNMTDAVQFRRSYDRMGRKKRRTASQLFNADIGRMSEIVFRWQQVSSSLLGPGNQVIAFGKAPAPATGYVCPLVFSSLTCNPMFPNSADFGARKVGLHRLTYEPSTKAFGHQFYRTQDKDGAQVLGEWQVEAGVAPDPVTSKVDPVIFHKWSEIRLNLYGSAYYPLTYEIVVLTDMGIDMSPFDYSSGGTPIFESTNLNAFFRDQCKDYIGNPIVGSSVNRSEFRDKFKVVRRKIVKIDPLSYQNAAVQELNVEFIDISNVRNVNMFIRHDRFRNYGWSPKTADQDLQTGLDGRGFDTQNISELSTASGYSDVDREERLYVMIKCTAGKAVEAAEFGIITADVPAVELSQQSIPPFSGSFDIIMRNCFRYNNL